MTGSRQALGAWGEERVARWYEAEGYRILDRNWRPSGGRGELDLVAELGRVIVFCEVKSRSSDRFGLPAEAVTADKQGRLRRLAGQWLARHPGSWSQVRFDVASVRRGRVEVIEAAF